MRGGTVDGYFFGVSFVQQIGQERWEDAMTGSSHSRAGVVRCAGLFSKWRLWSYFLYVCLQGTETAGGGH